MTVSPELRLVRVVVVVGEAGGSGFRAWSVGAKSRSSPDLEPAHDALLLGGAILIISRLAPKQVEGVQPVLEVVEL